MKVKILNDSGSGSDVKSIVKMTISLIVIVAAGIFIYRTLTGAGELTFETHKSSFVCVACQHMDFLTRDEMVQRNPNVLNQATTTIPCSQCEQGQMVGAKKCNNCGAHYPYNLYSEISACPKCKSAEN
jgi:hypothetical protein